MHEYYQLSKCYFCKKKYLINRSIYVFFFVCGEVKFSLKHEYLLKLLNVFIQIIV